MMPLVGLIRRKNKEMEKSNEKFSDVKSSQFDIPSLKFNIPTPNFEMITGEDYNCLRLCFTVKKTIRNRVKYWLFCRFFPFKITKWEVIK